MSQEKVEIVWKWARGYNSGGLDDVVDRYWHDDIEMWDPPGMPDADRYVGKDAVRLRVEAFHDFGWDGQVRVEEMTEVGEAVVVLWRMLGQAPGAGVPLDIVVAFVVLFEDGRVRHIRVHLNKDDALAAGLSE